MEPIEPPRFDPVRESLGIIDGLTRLPFGVFELGSLPRGQGEPVMVLPGFMTGDGSTLVLRAFLRALGYRVHGWGLGINRGEVVRHFRDVSARIEGLAHDRGDRVRLVGWSLGGMLARELGRWRPDLVHSVVTLGTPVVGGAKYTSLARLYERVLGGDLDVMEESLATMNKFPIRVPLTAIYTRNDNVVAWEACLDPDNAHVEHVEVGSTHLGLGFSPDVLRIIATRLARG